MTVPISTLLRTPIRSASQPMAMPPDPVPIQVSAPASARTERDTPRSSAIARSPTTISKVEPYATERIASVTPAATHEARLSIERGWRLAKDGPESLGMKETSDTYAPK